MAKLTKQEFIEKYPVEGGFKLCGFRGMTLMFKGVCSTEQKIVLIFMGGNSSDLIGAEFYSEDAESYESVSPFEGRCGEDCFYEY